MLKQRMRFSHNTSMRISTNDIERAQQYSDEAIRLRIALTAIVEWDKRNGGYAELPPLMLAAKSALGLKE